MKKPQVRAEIERLLNQSGITKEAVAKKWEQAMEVGWGDRASHKDALHALESVTKMLGLSPEKSSTQVRLNINAKAEQIPYDQLQADYKKLKATIDKMAIDSNLNAVNGEIVPPTT